METDSDKSLQLIINKIATVWDYDDLDDKWTAIYLHLKEIQALCPKFGEDLDIFLQKTAENNYDLYLFAENYQIKKFNISNIQENNFSIVSLKSNINCVSVVKETRRSNISITYTLKNNDKYELSADRRGYENLKNILEKKVIPNLI